MHNDIIPPVKQLRFLTADVLMQGLGMIMSLCMCHSFSIIMVCQVTLAHHQGPYFPCTEFHPDIFRQRSKKIPVWPSGFLILKRINNILEDYESDWLHIAFVSISIISVLRLNCINLKLLFNFINTSSRIPSLKHHLVRPLSFCAVSIAAWLFETPEIWSAPTL